MLKTHATRAIDCYHCGRRFEAAVKAILLSCPHCYQRVRIDDVVVRSVHHARTVETCGRILIEKKGWVMASFVRAPEGIEVLGAMEAKSVVSGPVLLGPKSRWKGDLTAPRLYIEPGATIEGGFFRIAAEPRQEPRQTGPRIDTDAHGSESEKCYSV